jgi:hypothetical protein
MPELVLDNITIYQLVTSKLKKTGVANANIVTSMGPATAGIAHLLIIQAIFHAENSLEILRGEDN